MSAIPAKSKRERGRCLKPWWAFWRDHEWTYGYYQYRPGEWEQCPKCGLRRKRMWPPFPATYLNDDSEKRARA